MNCLICGRLHFGIGLVFFLSVKLFVANSIVVGGGTAGLYRTASR